MKRFTFARTMALGAAVLSVAVVRAADDLPKAETILDKYVEATGGKAAYQKHRTEINTGTMEMPAMGLKATVTSYMAEGSKTYTEVDLGSFGKMRDGSDGKVFWQTSSMQGPHVKEGTEKAQAMLLERLNAELTWRDVFKDVKTTGVDTVEGKECYKVVLTPAEGSPITQCYDKQSGLMVKLSMTTESPMGQVPVDMFFTDFRKEDGVLMPHKTKQSFAGQEMNATITSVTFNAEIPKDKFDLPDEIKALVTKK